MRTFQVMMLTLCLLGGAYLLLHAPVFFMPDRWDPSVGREFSPLASRVLGGGLLSMAALALIFLRHHYYSATRRLPGPAMQRVYFGLVMLAITLVTLAFNLAEPQPNPEHRGSRPAPALPQ